MPISPPRTFSVQTLGCKVNQYEGEQLAALLRARGLHPAIGDEADLRIVHTCSVTMQAASKSRQTVRRATGGSRSLPVLGATPSTDEATLQSPAQSQSRVIVTGCWATSDPVAAHALPGVAAVLTHHGDLAGELDRLLDQWQNEEQPGGSFESGTKITASEQQKSPAEHSTHSAAQFPNDKSDSSDTTAGINALDIKPPEGREVKENIAFQATKSSNSGNGLAIGSNSLIKSAIGARGLPLLDQKQTGRQRALMKIQDGCDAHCTYCIIPQLRPALWSKPIDDAVTEARQLVAGGHVEIVLTGIFLGAFGQSTALRRRQPDGAAPLAGLIDALCTRVPGLRRVRLSSLEPGDLTSELLAVLQSHPQIVPHFHLPLQSGSDALLRKMNRQYTRSDFLKMVERVKSAFDRPALTTDIIVGFPGETTEAFDQTLDVARRAGFIHIHAFSFSPRPRTAAARWQTDFVRGPIVNERIESLRAEADAYSLTYRQSFVGQDVELLVEHEKTVTGEMGTSAIRHGRTERYFPVWFEDAAAQPGDFRRVKIKEVTPARTHGEPYSA